MLTQEQKQYIRKNYYSNKTSEIAKHLGLATRQVNTYASNCKLKKDPIVIECGKIINDKHKELIIKNYEYGDLDELSKKTGKSKHTISEWARRHNLKRKIDITRNGSLSNLISGTLESFYWLGFIAADGYIYKNGHLMVSQSEKDKETIYKLSKYLETSVYIFVAKSSYKENPGKTYRVNISDKIIGNKIREMFNVSDTLSKTYTGISLDFIKTKDQAYSFFCGFIDGDGSLTKSKSYKIECHSSWYKTFECLLKKLLINEKDFNLRNIERKDKKVTYVNLSVKKAFSEELRKFAKENNIPCSSRKFTI